MTGALVFIGFGVLAVAINLVALVEQVKRIAKSLEENQR